MSEPVEGTWNCIVLGGEANADDKDIMHVRINVQITEGPDKGRKVTYDEQVNNKSAKYVAMSAKAVGWQGGRLESTFRADVEAWLKATGGASTVEIQHIERKTGKEYDKWYDGGCQGQRPFWAKARSIGRGPKPLKAPSQQSANDADEAMRAAMAESNGGGGGGYDEAPPPSDDDIPFITDSMAGDRGRRW